MLSEAEMKEFFQRVVDEVAQLSTQASQVEGLRNQVKDLYERVNSLESDNNQLRGQLADAYSTTQRVEAEIASVRSQYENEQRAVSALRETIFQRDSKVQELEGYLNVERDAHKITLSERDDARQSISELNQANGQLNDALSHTTTEKNEWRNKAIDAESKVNDLQQRLDRVQAILNPIRAVPLSADVA